MAFQLMEWINKVTKLNKTTMDTFQNNIKNAIEDVDTKVTNVDNKVEELDTESKKDCIAYDLTLENNSTHVSIPCNILEDGGYYELLFIGRYADGVGDMNLNLNDNKNDIYYQSGFAYNFNADSDTTAPNIWSGYRGGKNSFYICSSIISDGFARCMLKYKIALLKANDIPCMSIENTRSFSGNSSNGQASCQTSVKFDNITTIDLYPNLGSTSGFAAGSRFILKKNKK